MTMELRIKKNYTDNHHTLEDVAYFECQVTYREGDDELRNDVYVEYEDGREETWTGAEIGSAWDY